MVDGQLRLLSIADREKSHEIEGDIPHVSRIVYPSRFTDEVKDEAMAIVKKVADFVGITTGPLSMQFFYTPGQGVQVCEIAGRMFGYEHELVTYAGGMSVEQLLLNYVYDEAALKEMFDAHDPHFSRFSAGVYFHGYEGTVADVSAAEVAAKLPGVAESLIYYQPGETIGHGVGGKALRGALLSDGGSAGGAGCADPAAVRAGEGVRRTGQQLSVSQSDAESKERSMPMKQHNSSRPYPDRASCSAGNLFPQWLFQQKCRRPALSELEIHCLLLRHDGHHGHLRRGLAAGDQAAASQRWPSPTRRSRWYGGFCGERCSSTNPSPPAS